MSRLSENVWSPQPDTGLLLSPRLPDDGPLSSVSPVAVSRHGQRPRFSLRRAVLLLSDAYGGAERGITGDGNVSLFRSTSSGETKVLIPLQT